MGYKPKPEGYKSRQLLTEAIMDLQRAIEIICLDSLSQSDVVKKTAAEGRALDKLRQANNLLNQVNKIYDDAIEESRGGNQ